YAFTIGQSPFGKIYFESIKRKLRKSDGNSLFIISVDPWSISSKSKDPNDITLFRENGLCLDNTKIVNMKPNIIYLLNNVKGRNIDFLKNIDKKKTLLLKQNGRLQVTVDMDAISVKKRLKRKIRSYNKKLRGYRFSEKRLAYLNTTIEFLKNYGSVYLIRLPIHPQIFKIENRLMPDFEQKIQTTKLLSDGYLDLTPRNAEFMYTDGNHLYKQSGRQVSNIIAHWITETKKKKENTPTTLH
ncbi:MAG: hypothetical protein PF482_19860, partial [Desulfobacteraceae bacterium]|nr:hypothetical protein [Desulfobacteraceae bacterium]